MAYYCKYISKEETKPDVHIIYFGADGDCGMCHPDLSFAKSHCARLLREQCIHAKPYSTITHKEA